MKIKIIRKLGMGNIQLKTRMGRNLYNKDFLKILKNHTNNAR